MRRRHHTLRLALALVAATFVHALPAASAAWPTAVDGYWFVALDRASFPGDLLFLHQLSAGTDCSAVVGNFDEALEVNGSYCPATGRLVLALGNGGATEQVWTLQFSTAAANGKGTATGTASRLAGEAAALAEVPLALVFKN